MMAAPGLQEARWLRHACLASLVIATSGFTLWFACATPFAAFGAFAAIALSRGDARRAMVGLWLANQAIGYLVLGYPRTSNSFAWGLAIGGVAILSLLAAQRIASRLRSTPVFRPVAVLGGAFTVYEVTIYVIASGWLGGTSSLAPTIVSRVLILNVVALAILLVLYRLGAAVGLTWQPVAAATSPAQPASS